MHWGDLFQSVGLLFVGATASAKTMVRLRTFGIVANCFLIIYYFTGQAWVPMASRAIALPLNGWRLRRTPRRVAERSTARSKRNAAC